MESTSGNSKRYRLYVWGSGTIKKVLDKSGRQYCFDTLEAAEVEAKIQALTRKQCILIADYSGKYESKITTVINYE